MNIYYMTQCWNIKELYLGALTLLMQNKKYKTTGIIIQQRVKFTMWGAENFGVGIL